MSIVRKSKNTTPGSINMNDILTKTCNECAEDLPLFQFGYSPTRAIYNAKCKQCAKNRRKDWYSKDPNLVYGQWSSKK